MSTASLTPAVRAALAAVVRDVDAHGIGVHVEVPARSVEGSSALRPASTAQGDGGCDDQADDQPADLWVRQSDGAETSVFVDPVDPEAVSAAHVADVVHDSALDDLRGQGRDTAWPPCPQHPGTHPLVVAVGEPAPTWTCPTSGTVVCAVGEVSPRS